VGSLELILWVIGGALIVIGLLRARGPWARYQHVKAQDENVARYERWRGGVHSSASEKTGASVAMEILRRQVMVAVAITIIGVVCVIAGFVLG